MNDSPLREAIKKLNRAKRCRAHPLIICRLDARVKEEAHKVNEILLRAGGISKLIYGQLEVNDFNGRKKDNI